MVTSRHSLLELELELEGVGRNGIKRGGHITLDPPTSTSTCGYSTLCTVTKFKIRLNRLGEGTKGSFLKCLVGFTMRFTARFKASGSDVSPNRRRTNLG